ncbi:MAG: hypothetical protein AAF363_03125 [Bacteroidota bacterium]
MSLIFSGSLVLAQEFPSQAWHKGKLVTNEGDTVKGLIKYDQETDIVQIQQGTKTKTFTARKFSYFEILDQLSGYYRYFYTIPFQSGPGYRVPQLFELLQEGNLTLLSREYIVTENLPQYNSYYQSSFSRQRLNYTFYILEESKDLYRYNGKRNDLLEIMDDYESEIKKYIRKNRLRTDEKRDIVRIVAYYNALEQDS